MSRSWRRVSPMCVQGARSILLRPVQRCDCSGRESRQTAFTGTSPAPGCKRSRISDLGWLPSSPEGNYLQETSQASRSTTSPQTSPTAALTLSELWQPIAFVMHLLAFSVQLQESSFHCRKKDTVKREEAEIWISIRESSPLLWISWSYRCLQEEALGASSLWRCRAGVSPGNCHRVGGCPEGFLSHTPMTGWSY